MLKLVYATTVVILFCANVYPQQQVAAFDVIPLRKGLCYEYAYYYTYQDYALTYLVSVFTDSGSVRYSVLVSVGHGKDYL
jgi:hypothetical protein